MGIPHAGPSLLAVPACNASDSRCSVENCRTLMLGCTLRLNGGTNATWVAAAQDAGYDTLDAALQYCAVRTAHRVRRNAIKPIQLQRDLPSRRRRCLLRVQLRLQPAQRGLLRRVSDRLVLFRRDFGTDEKRRAGLPPVERALPSPQSARRAASPSSAAR